jgi:hypothetical protein
MVMYPRYSHGLQQDPEDAVMAYRGSPHPTQGEMWEFLVIFENCKSLFTHNCGLLDDLVAGN